LAQIVHRQSRLQQLFVDTTQAPEVDIRSWRMSRANVEECRPERCRELGSLYIMLLA